MRDITKLKLIVAFIVVTALCVGAIWFLVPRPAGISGGTFYSPFGTPTTLVDLMLAIGGGALFLRALRNFKKELKPAWRLVALAQITVGVFTMLFPYIEYYYLWPNVWWNMSSYLAYLFGSILMYLGMRKFYKLLALKSHVTSILLVGATILIAWVIHAFIPHPITWTQFNEHQYDLFEIIPTIPVICYSAAAYLAFRMRAKAGNEYSRSFTWLSIGLSLQAFAAITVAVLELIGYENWYFASRAYEIPLIVGDLGILIAAYYFNAIGLPTNRYSLWSRMIGRAKPRPVTSTDIIVYVAGMASDVSKIDSYLDGMRSVTAQHRSGEALTENDQHRLYDVYVEIEKYLVNNEPLRSFDVASLRHDVARHFGLDDGNTDNVTFWSHITPPAA